MTPACTCPQETGLTRRTLLRTATAAGALGLVSTAVGEGVTTRYAFADTTRNPSEPSASR